LGNIEGLRNSLVENKIKAYVINSIENITFRNREELSYIKEELVHLCEIAEKIRYGYIVVVPSQKPLGVSKKEIKQESVVTLKELSKIAQTYDVGLAFEFIGPGNSSVKTLNDAWQIVKAIETNNVGLVIDSFHFYSEGYNRAISIGVHAGILAQDGRVTLTGIADIKKELRESLAAKFKTKVFASWDNLQ